MAYALVLGLSQGTSANGGDTAEYDTTGVSIFFAVESFYSGLGSPTFTDSKGNTWELVESGDSGGGPSAAFHLYYSLPTSVGSGHTFGSFGTQTYPTISVLGLTGNDPVDPFTGQSVSDDSLAATSLSVGATQTPSEDNCVVIGAVTLGSTSTTQPVADDGFSAYSLQLNSGFSMGGGIAFKIQTSAAPVAPTWTWGGDSVAVTVGQAIFRSTSGGGGVGQPATRRWGGVPHLGTQKLRGGHRGGPWGYRRQEAA